MLTISRIARKFGLSRSTLLYYDSLGLLSPQERSHNGYRIYGSEEQARLERICMYRRAGIPLEEIGRILDSPETGVARVLEKRMAELEDEMDTLREQQRVLRGLLNAAGTVVPEGQMDKAFWVRLMAASGMGEADMRKWHCEFEVASPEAHKAFLVSLGIPAEEIEGIRSWALAARDE